MIEFLAKTFARHITAYCGHCDANRLDQILNRSEDPSLKLCLDCKLHAKIFDYLIDSISSKTELENIKPFFENPRYKKTLKNIVRGVAKFGISKPFISGKPIAVVWNFTNRCNMRCSHCYASSGNSNNEPELSTSECYKIVDRLVEADVAELNFTGGEPLVREDFFNVARYAKENELHITLASNGLLLSKDYVLKLNEVGVSSVNISLDGSSPETHERIRGVKGSFYLTVEGIKNSVKYGFFDEVIVNTTLTNYLTDDIPQIYEFVKELGVSKYYVSRILPYGRGKDFLKYDVSPGEKIRILKFLYDKFKGFIDGYDEIPALARGMTYFAKMCHDESRGHFFPVSEILTGHERTHQETFGENIPSVINSLREFFSGCATGLLYCGLAPDGEVLPCAPAMEFKLGSLLENSLEDIWLNHSIFSVLRNRNEVNGNCGRCVDKVICGGCRLTAFGTSGDWLASDPSCPF